MALEIVQIIEDEPAHAALLDDALRKARYRTHVTYDGRSGIDDAKRLQPALILLDMMLPGLEGHEVCRRLRDDPHTWTIPIIAVAALGSEEHRLTAFESGVDDYVTKPFSPREVVSRVKVVLGRCRSKPAEQESYLDGQLRLEGGFSIVSFRGRRLQLTDVEWSVLRRLAHKAGEVVTREELISRLWGEDGLIHEHELHRLIRSLDRCLSGTTRDWGAIIAVPGGGYVLRLLPA
jgi:DNA-binding response OmpR family regulator